MADLTPADLDRLEALERQSTSTPWFLGASNVTIWSGCYRLMQAVSDFPIPNSVEFVVLLRNLAPALFAAARERDTLREALNQLTEQMAKIDAENARLRTACDTPACLSIADQIGQAESCAVAAERAAVVKFLRENFHPDMFAANEIEAGKHRESALNPNTKP